MRVQMPSLTYMIDNFVRVGNRNQPQNVFKMAAIKYIILNLDENVTLVSLSDN